MPYETRTGNSTRSCSSNGIWSGSSLTCYIPDPCLRQPCAEFAECVRDKIALERYTCPCIPGAFGDPSPDGSKCIMPRFEADSGSVVLIAPEEKDIYFQIGGANHSIRSIDFGLKSISMVGGALDSKVSVGVASLSSAVQVSIVQADSQSIATVTSTLTFQNEIATSTTSNDATNRASNALISASNDATAKINAANSTASQNVNAYSSTARAQTLSLAQVNDSVTLSSAIAYTDSMKVSIASQIAGLFVCLFAMKIFSSSADALIIKIRSKIIGLLKLEHSIRMIMFVVITLKILTVTL
jgi:hypothetical protein